MPQFSSGEQKTAIAPITVKPSGLSCQIELALMSNGVKAATSVVPFTSTGAQQPVSLPITMPGAEGTYPVYLDILAEDLLIGAFVATEDVVIAPAVPANLLSNPSFEADFEGWTPWINEAGGGRAAWWIRTDYPRTGSKSAAFSASVGGRAVVGTLSQIVPWQAGYRGQTFRFSVWRSIQTTRKGHDREGYFSIMIDDGVGITENKIYIGRSGYVEQSINKTLDANANKLQVICQIIPHRTWLGLGLYVDDTDLRRV